MLRRKGRRREEEEGLQRGREGGRKELEWREVEG